MLEPTDCILHAGCLGNVEARLDFHGESAHSARPWTGVNAIHELVRGIRPLVDLEPVDVELDGLVYREVVSAVRVAGGDRVERRSRRGERRAELPLRAGAVARRGGGRLRELAPDGELASSATRRRRRRPDEPARRAAARARSRGRAEAGVDAGRAVRGAGHRRDQLRPGRDRVRAQARRAGADREPRALLRDAAALPARYGLVDARADRPHARRHGDVSVRPPRGGAAAAARRRRRGDRLRQGRPERADRSDDPRGARRRAAGARRRIRSRRGCRSCAQAVADWCARRFGVELDPDTEIVPTYGSKEAIFSLAQVLVDPHADKRLVVFGEPAYPVYERGALFAGAERADAAAAAGARVPAGSRRGRRGDVGAHGDRLGQLSEQSDRRGRTARVLRASSPSSPRGTTSCSPPTRRTASSGSTSRRRRRCRPPDRSRDRSSSRR